MTPTNTLTADLIAQKVAKQQIDDFKSVLQTPEGRRFYARLCERCFENCTTYTGNAQTYFNEGMRNVSLILKADIRSMGEQGRTLKQQSEAEYENALDMISLVAEGEAKTLSEATGNQMDPRNIITQARGKRPY